MCLNDEQTLIMTVDPGFAHFWTIRQCSLVLSVQLPDNFGQPTAALVLRGGMYAVVSS